MLDSRLFWIRTSTLALGIVLLISIALMTYALSARADDSSTASTTSDATVSTGDAVSSTDASNSVNTTDANAPLSTATTSVATDNSTIITTDASSTAQTGDNAALSDASSTPVASVSSGDAVASANVINVANTTVVDSSGLIAFLTSLFGGDVDLRSLGFNSVFGDAPNTDPCSLSACSSAEVTSTSSATISNTIEVGAQTGGNTASSTGQASVSSGNAYAAANVLNVANSTIVDSHYLLLSLNAFGGGSGDIVLPNADFFESLMHSGTPATAVVDSVSSSSVLSDASAIADTGGNAASSTEGAASVMSGSATANTSTVTQANTTGVGGANIFLLLNVVGDWSGSVRGLPPGISWVQTPGGVALTSLSGDFSSISTPASANVESANSASISNHVQVFALTGSNQASGVSGASVSSGNAYASANIINLVNNTVLGQNWIFAMLNVFGDWSGNLTFGRPDLWLGISAANGNPAAPGDRIAYRFTVANRGDLDATNVRLAATYDAGLLSFEGEGAPGSSTWDLGDIKAGESKDFIYYAKTGPVQNGLAKVPLSATVLSDDTDNNPTDNTDNITILVGSPDYSWRGPGKGAGEPDPLLTLEKSANAASTTASSSVSYSLTVSDSDGPAYRTTLTDKLYGPDGSEVSEHAWNLDDINPGDNITLTYSVGFGEDAEPGFYTDVSTLTGQRGNSVWQYAYDMSPVAATTTTLVLPGVVLGAETDAPLLPQCLPLITSYLRQGAHNDPEQVHLLQYYLSTFEGIAVKQTNTFDAQTTAAVKEFQLKYANDILTPWHVTSPSGEVLMMTEREINSRYCSMHQ